LFLTVASYDRRNLRRINAAETKSGMRNRPIGTSLQDFDVFVCVALGVEAVDDGLTAPRRLMGLDEVRR
jgi:hypothetical protein